jgi:nitrogen fixation NifU-like protein
MDEPIENGPDQTGPDLDPSFWRHARFPANTQPLTRVDGWGTAVGSCGDRVTIEVTVVRDLIQAICQRPEGCLYTTACASAVSTLAKGCTMETALEIQPADVEFHLGGLPEDHRHCARLAVNTLGEAIADVYRRNIIHTTSAAE